MDAAIEQLDISCKIHVLVLLDLSKKKTARF
jgi:hypothetical protein